MKHISTKGIALKVKHYKVLRRKSGRMEDTFDESKKHCEHYKAYIDKFDGEHIPKCKHVGHPNANKRLFAECLIDNCPLT